jgi:hypothetical protein
MLDAWALGLIRNDREQSFKQAFARHKRSPEFGLAHLFRVVE